MLRSCTRNHHFQGQLPFDEARKYLVDLLLRLEIEPRHIRCPRWNTEGDSDV